MPLKEIILLCYLAAFVIISTVLFGLVLYFGGRFIANRRDRQTLDPES